MSKDEETPEKATSANPTAEGTESTLDGAKSASGAHAVTAKADAASEVAAEKADAAKANAVATDEAATAEVSEKPAKKKRRNPIAAIGLFFQQVGGELRKVITPTRGELFSYVGVVLSFVLFMMVLVTVFDFLFGFASSWAFGTGQELFPQQPPAPTAPVDPSAVPTPSGAPVPAPSDAATPAVSGVPATTAPAGQ